MFAAAVASIAAVAGGGAAVAATTLDSPEEESKAIVDDAAKQLGVTPAELTAALKQALENRVDAAVAAGRITEAQADAMRAEIEAGNVPLLGFGGGPRVLHGHGVDLDDVATYLGLTQDELRTALESGKSLAAIAQAEGKSVDGLVDTLVASAKERLDADVAAGRLTDAQRDSILADLEDRITELVNSTPGMHRGVVMDAHPSLAPSA
jgi:hypothetical protein